SPPHLCPPAGKRASAQPAWDRFETSRHRKNSWRYHDGKAFILGETASSAFGQQGAIERFDPPRHGRERKMAFDMGEAGAHFRLGGLGSVERRLHRLP